MQRRGGGGLGAEERHKYGENDCRRVFRAPTGARQRRGKTSEGAGEAVIKRPIESSGVRSVILAVRWMSVAREV